MKSVTMIETSDGKLHSTIGQAIRHAEIRYGDALSRLAHRLIQCEKYTTMQAYLDEHLDEFVALQALKADITLVKSEEE